MNRLLFVLILFIHLSGYAQPRTESMLPEDPVEAFRECYIKADQLVSTNPKQALQYGEIALEKALQLEDDTKISGAYYVLGRAANQHRDFVKGFEYFSRAKSIYEIQGQKDYYAYCLWGIAVAYRNTGQYDMARVCYEEVKAIIYDNGASETKASLMRDIANLDLEQGNLKESIPLFRQALTLSLDTKNLSFANIRLGYCFRELGKTDSALYHYQLAYQYAKEAKLPHLIARSLAYLGHYHLSQGQPEKAIEFFFEGSAQMSLLETDYALAVQIQRNLALAYFEAGMNQKGAEVLYALFESEELMHGKRESLRAFDLLIDRYLYPRQALDEIQEIRAQRQVYEDWLLSNQPDSLAITAAQILTVEKALAVESMQKTQPILERRWKLLAIVILSSIGAFLLWFFLRYQPQRKHNKANRKELDALRERFRTMQEGLRRGSNLRAFRE